MSILNIGLQSVGVMRQKTQSCEDQLKNCNSLASIRKLELSTPCLAEEVIDAVTPTKILLQDVITRLHLKDHKFETSEAASKSEIE